MSPIKSKLLMAGSVCMILAGCASTAGPDSNSSKIASALDVSQGNFVDVYLCRKESIVRSAEAPELRVGGEILGQLGSGGELTLQLKEGVNLELFLGSNPLMYRFKDSVIYSRKLVRGEKIYLSVNPERNVVQGLTIFFGGAVAESIRQNNESKDNSWSVLELKERPAEGCNL